MKEKYRLGNSGDISQKPTAKIAPKVFTNPNDPEYKRRLQAYNDSLNVYNKYNNYSPSKVKYEKKWTDNKAKSEYDGLENKQKMFWDESNKYSDNLRKKLGIVKGKATKEQNDKFSEVMNNDRIYQHGLKLYGEMNDRMGYLQDQYNRDVPNFHVKYFDKKDTNFQEKGIKPTNWINEKYTYDENYVPYFTDKNRYGTIYSANDNSTGNSSSKEKTINQYYPVFKKPVQEIKLQPSQQAIPQIQAQVPINNQPTIQPQVKQQPQQFIPSQQIQPTLTPIPQRQVQQIIPTTPLPSVLPMQQIQTPNVPQGKQWTPYTHEDEEFYKYDTTTGRYIPRTREERIEIYNSKQNSIKTKLGNGGGVKPSYEVYYKTIPSFKNDTSSYDLRRAYNELPYADMVKFAITNKGHLPDTYKLSNHPTFSNESIYYNTLTSPKGGYWDDRGYRANDPLNTNHIYTDNPEVRPFGVMPNNLNNMIKKKKLLIGGNVVANPYANMISINKYDARNSANNYLKDRAKAKALGDGISGIATGALGIATGNAGLIKSGISDTIGSLGSKPIDMSTANNIYGYQGMKPNDNMTNGLSPIVGGALQTDLMGSVNKLFPSAMSNGGEITWNNTSLTPTQKYTVDTSMYNRGVVTNTNKVSDNLFGKESYKAGSIFNFTPEQKANYIKGIEKRRLQKIRDTQSNINTRNPNYDLNGNPISTLVTNYRNGGRIRFDGGGGYTEDLMPSWLNPKQNTTSNRLYDNSTYGDINKMTPKYNYINSNTDVPTLLPRETTTADNMVGGKDTLNKGFNLNSIADLNPLGIGSKLQNAGMNEYGVITDDASYYTGAVLNPIGALATWAGNGFASQTTLKNKMGKHIQDMTYENLNNETNSKNAEQMSTDYMRLNNYSNKGNREVNMGFANGGRILLASNAQQITGPKHAQGGVDIAPNVEAEGGEVMAQSPQSGDTQVFSDKNGYADVVKPLLKQKGILEKELMTTGVEMVKLRKAFTTSKDDLSRAGIGRNLEKIQSKVFTLKATITQIDKQVEQIFAQQQQGNGNQGVEGEQPQGMKYGGYIASRGLKIPPVGDNTSYTPDDNIVDYTDVKYPINFNTNTYPINTVPMFNYNMGSVNNTNDNFDLTTLVPSWANGYQDNTNNRSIIQNAINATKLNRYNLPQNMLQKTYPLANVTSTKETTTKDKKKGKWNFDGVQDIVIPGTEYALQSQLASKMENTPLPKSEQYKFNPLDTRFTPDAELNLIQRNVNNTTNQIRNNSSNPYYANAVRANIAMESNDKSAAAIDKANKLNLDIYAQNNTGFNNVNQNNVNLRNQDKQLAYNKAITDLERRSSIVGNTTNRGIEFANNRRSYDLQKKNLEIDALKYNDTIGGKYTEGMIHGRLTEIFQDMKGKNADINTTLTTDEKANARKQYKELGDATLSTKQSGLIHNKLIELGFTWNGKKYVD